MKRFLWFAGMGRLLQTLHLQRTPSLRSLTLSTQETSEGQQEPQQDRWRKCQQRVDDQQPNHDGDGRLCPVRGSIEEGNGSDQPKRESEQYR